MKKINTYILLILSIFILASCKEENVDVCDGVNHIIKVDALVEATCEEDGLTEGAHCEKCGQVIKAQETTPALGHNYVLESSNNNYLVYKCTRCNESYQEEIGNRDVCSENHVASDWIVISDATCDSLGSKHKICTVCNIELEKDSIPMTEHHIVTDEKEEAGCELTGLTEGKHCDICGKVTVSQEEIAALGHDYVLINTTAPTLEKEGYLEYECSRCNKTYQKVLPVLTEYDDTLPTTIILNDNESIVGNNNGGVVIDNSDITITMAGEYTLTGKLTNGSITVTLQEDEKITINLEGVNISCDYANPIYITEGDKVEISAKSGTDNFIYDKRAFTDAATGAAIYSEIDMEVKGKGQLTVETAYNNGIATKDDLTIKNLTLMVTACNNAIKGNDSLTIESGNITAISTNGDALKTENSDISSKGNQRGIITIEDGIINLYAACDGIDAAYDVIINGGEINIYTESYSKYSQEVTASSSEKIYLRLSSRTSLPSNYKYSALFTLTDGTTVWENLTSLQSGQTRYFQGNKQGDAKYVKFYIYNSTQTQGQSTNYTYVSDQLTIPTTYDTFYISSISTTNISGSWTNYTTTQIGGNRPGGMGGMEEGNPDSALYSCKGIKADNQVVIKNGTINISSHDDAIHANYDTLLETSSYGIGNVTISGGTIIINSDDDAIHADNILTIEGGNIVVNSSYEGYEGNTINIKGGISQITSSDDGVNAKSTLNISSGTLYLNSNGDGLDSNGTITMTGGIVLAVGPTSGGNGVLDFDRSFSFSGGLLVAIGASGMNQKPTATSGNTSATKSISTNTSSYITVTSNNEVVAVIKVNKTNQNYCVYAYNNASYPSLSVTVSSSNTISLVNGLYFALK